LVGGWYAQRIYDTLLMIRKPAVVAMMAVMRIGHQGERDVLRANQLNGFTMQK